MVRLVHENQKTSNLYLTMRIHSLIPNSKSPNTFFKKDLDLKPPPLLHRPPSNLPYKNPQKCSTSDKESYGYIRG